MKAVAAAILLLGVAYAAAGMQPPRVTAVHPDADIVPENLLRLYVDFSQPMQGGDAFQHIRLLDRNGPIQDAFREVELWSRDHRRLMVYIHPGRIKRGLEFSASMGPVLREGERFTLEIAPGMKSRDGIAVAASVSRVLKVGAADRDMPDLARWTITRDGVEVDEWMDHAGLEDFVTVDGRRPLLVEGRRLHFDLAPGTHVLTVDSRLEDLSGNNFRRRFETRAGEEGRDLPHVQRTVTVPR